MYFNSDISPRCNFVKNNYLDEINSFGILNQHMRVHTCKQLYSMKSPLGIYRLLLEPNRSLYFVGR